MKKSEVTVEQFARWSVEEDVKNRLLPRYATLENIPVDERDIYLSEADCYINDEPAIGWPCFIVEKLDKE